MAEPQPPPDVPQSEPQPVVPSESQVTTVPALTPVASILQANDAAELEDARARIREASGEPIEPTQPREEDRQESPFQRRIRETQEKVSASRVKITTHLASFSVEAPSGELEVIPSHQEVLDTAQRLIAIEVTNPTEYIETTKPFVQSAQVVLRSIKTQLLETGRIWGLERDLDYIERDLARINTSGLLGKTVGLRKRQRLTSERNDLMGQIKDLRSLDTQLTSRKNDIERLLAILKERRGLFIREEIIKEFGVIAQEYGSLGRELLVDSSLIDEVQEGYINNVLIPEIDKQIASGQARNPLAKEEYLKRLRTYLAHRDDPNTNLTDLRSEYSTYTDTGLRLGGYGSTDEILTQGEDRGIVAELIANFAAPEVRGLYEELDIAGHQLDTYQLKRALFEAFPSDMTIGPLATRDDPGLGIRRTISKFIAGPKDWVPNMDLWHAVRNSKTAQELFGNTVAQMDQSFYEIILQKSSEETGGFWVARLKHYPTPEVVRRLVVLVSSEYGGNNQQMADDVLGEFAKRDDWHILLDEAERLAPDLHDVRALLESWDYTRKHDVYEEIKPVGQRMITRVLKDPQSDVSLVTLCEKGASEDILLDLLVERGVVSSEDASLLASMDQILFDAALASREKQIVRIDSSHFTPVLREQMLAVLRNRDSAQQVNANERLGRMISLAKIISQHKTDIAKLDYYSDRQMIDYLVAQNFSAQQAELLLRAPELCPALTHDYSLRGILLNSSETFLNEEMLRSLSKVEESYRGMEEPVRNDLLFKVIFHNLDIERLLQLSVSAQDILQGPYAKLAIENSDIGLKTDADVSFFRNVITTFDDGSEDFFTFYRDALLKGQITIDSRDDFFNNYKFFADVYTLFTPERAEQLKQVSQSPFGRAVSEVITDEMHRHQILLDYSCYVERLESNKIGLLQRTLSTGVSSPHLQEVATYLRWLPESEVLLTDTRDSLKAKYESSLQNLQEGFTKLFSYASDDGTVIAGAEGLNSRLDDICKRFRIETVPLTIEGMRINVPRNFVKIFSSQRKINPDTQFIPAFTGYIIDYVTKSSTAFTVEDSLFSQIGDTEDRTGRRRGRYTSEKLLEEMEENITASLRTWTTAINYQDERSDSPLFIIANERTGPADVAAEYLPEEFAQTHKVAQNVDYDKFFDWFKTNEQLVVELYDRHLAGEDVHSEIPQEAFQFLDLEGHSIIPIYRLKVPSSLDAATHEPEGIDTIINFLKLSSLMDGRVLFMDESTRSAPRSIECLYNVLNRRQEALGRVDIRLFGKIDNATGQNGTVLSAVNGESTHMEIGFIDPWESQAKSVADDSEGFVPEISGKGVVEIVRPSLAAVSPYGISTIQDFWKQLIASEVAARYDQFVASGGEKQPKSVFRTPIPSSDEILTQEELLQRALSQTYRSLVIDLDGTIGQAGRYDENIIAKLKQLAEEGVEVVFATSRSKIDHQEYDGSTQSLVLQLGELTDSQRAHLYLATENGAVLSSLFEEQAPLLQFDLSDEVFQSLETNVFNDHPELNVYRETGTVVLRGFDRQNKQTIIDDLAFKLHQLGLPIKVMSDSRGAIHLRVNAASKRNVLDWLESRGISLNDIAKIGDSPAGNDRPMFLGTGAFNVGSDREGTPWTIHMEDQGGGIAETTTLLEKLKFTSSQL